MRIHEIQNHICRTDEYEVAHFSSKDKAPDSNPGLVSIQFPVKEIYHLPINSFILKDQKERYADVLKSYLSSHGNCYNAIVSAPGNRVSNLRSGHHSEYRVASISCFSLLSITLPIFLRSGGNSGRLGASRV
jgi:hypothetical protein